MPSPHLILLPHLNLPGIRQARVSDVDGVQAILAPLEKEGTLVKRNRNELESCITDFVVIEREGKVSGRGGREGGEEKEGKENWMEEGKGAMDVGRARHAGEDVC